MGEQQPQAGPGCLVSLAVVLAGIGLYVLNLGYGGIQVFVFGLLFLVAAVVLVCQAWRQKGEQIMNEGGGEQADRAGPEDSTED